METYTPRTRTSLNPLSKVRVLLLEPSSDRSLVFSGAPRDGGGEDAGCLDEGTYPISEVLWLETGGSVTF